MSRYVLSIEADRDIQHIGRESVETWGWDQAENYLRGLHQAFDVLAQFPALGRDVSHLRAGYRRFEHARHSVFYRVLPDGVLIVRVLHNRMQPGLHL